MIRMDGAPPPPTLVKSFAVVADFCLFAEAAGKEGRRVRTTASGSWFQDGSSRCRSALYRAVRCTIHCMATEAGPVHPQCTPSAALDELGLSKRERKRLQKLQAHEMAEAGRIQFNPSLPAPPAVQAPEASAASEAFAISGDDVRREWCTPRAQPPAASSLAQCHKRCC